MSSRANLANAGVILKGEPDAQGFEADLLAEEIRLLFYELDDHFRLNGYKHLAAKLHKTSGRDREKALPKLMKACIRVLQTEFPNQTGLQDKVYGQNWHVDQVQTDEEFITAVINNLQNAHEIFSACFAQLSPVVQLAFKYIRGSVKIGEGGSIKEFSGKNGMNPAYLGHLFKKETGSFFNEYLNRCRINQSVILLRNPDRKVKDIALSVGFMSTSYIVLSGGTILIGYNTDKDESYPNTSNEGL